MCEIQLINEKLTCKVIVVEVELPQFDQTRKLIPIQLWQLVGLKVKNSQLKWKCLFSSEIVWDERPAGRTVQGTPLTSVRPSREKLVTVLMWLLFRNTVWIRLLPGDVNKINCCSNDYELKVTHQ